MSEYLLRLQAAKLGAKRYTGKQCAVHPGSQRYTSNGACVECTMAKKNSAHNIIRDLLKKNSAA